MKRERKKDRIRPCLIVKNPHNYQGKLKKQLNESYGGFFKILQTIPLVLKYRGRVSILRIVSVH
jgi:hypothetical protein